MEPGQTKSKWSVIEPLVVIVPKTSGDQLVDIPWKRDHPLFSYHLQGFGKWREIGRAARHTRLAEEVFIPGRIQARGGRRKHIKNGDLHRNVDLS